jgi:magnesium-transporting ATPase (P-type)
VLLRPDLGILLGGIDEGRRTFANTQKYIMTTISANFGNMVSMAVASAAAAISAAAGLTDPAQQLSFLIFRGQPLHQMLWMRNGSGDLGDGIRAN